MTEHIAELPIAPKSLTTIERRREGVLRLNEIFYSIQGESSLAGERCTFIRLTGCGLRCSYCDTEYAFYEGSDFEVESIVEKVKTIGCKLVEITGGEPLEQEGVYPLMEALLREQFEVMLETGGHVDVSRVPVAVKRIIDVKTPSSNMAKRNREENLNALRPTDEIKFVIGSREDYEFARVVTVSNHLASRTAAVLFSPVFGTIEPLSIVNWILEDQLPVRFQLQMHKFIWPPDERGV